MQYWRCFFGVLERELRKFSQQKSRLLSALVRPLLWLFVFAAGFRSTLSQSTLSVAERALAYEEYIVPGLAAMIILFNSMQTSLSMVYDREMGSMKILLLSPFPREFLLGSKLISNAIISGFQVYVFLLFALLVDVRFDLLAYFFALPVIIMLALFLGSLGLILANYIRQLENFAGIMNFVIFPMFFLSSALYPLSKMREANEFLYWLCLINPFSSGVELLRFSFYKQIDGTSFVIVLLTSVLCFLFAVRSFEPKANKHPKGAGKT